MQVRNPLTTRGNTALFLTLCGILACLFLLAGCVKQPPRPPTEPSSPIAAVPTPAPDVPPAPPVALVEQPRLDPAIEAAMRQYHATGKAPVIARKDQAFVRFPYGLSEPTVYCQLLHVCEIELEEGEAVVGKPVCGACWTEPEQGGQGNLDDTGYLWELNGFLSGPEGRRTQHITLKPREYAGPTNLLFGTDKGRVYRLRLVPKVKQRDIRVSFYYPEEAEKQFAAMRAQVVQEKAAQQPRDIACGFALPPDQLDQRYRVEGGPAWVANDGKTTCVRPPSMNGDLPVVFTEGADGKTSLLNYRVREGYYQIDGVPGVLSFVSGAGDAKRTVTVTREGN